MGRGDRQTPCPTDPRRRESRVWLRAPRRRKQVVPCPVICWPQSKGIAFGPVSTLRGSKSPKPKHEHNESARLFALCSQFSCSDFQTRLPWPQSPLGAASVFRMAIATFRTKSMGPDIGKGADIFDKPSFWRRIDHRLGNASQIGKPRQKTFVGNGLKPPWDNKPVLLDFQPH